MLRKNTPSSIMNKEADWLTINEAIKLASKSKGRKIKASDIYRHALSKNIYLSIYFQSPIFIRKIKTIKNKLKLMPLNNPSMARLCFLEGHCFLNNRKCILSTKGKYICSMQRIIDTSLDGYEYILAQKYLALSLNIPLPITGANDVNYGITVRLAGEIYQIFERTTWSERVKYQLSRFPSTLSHEITNQLAYEKTDRLSSKGYFPLHDLPKDACFVIRYTEFEKLIGLCNKNVKEPTSTTRISTPLSRLFWLACKNNETIRPLIKQPYKLLSIFEQWASNDGITDRLSGDTLKSALERGSPSSTSLPG